MFLKMVKHEFHAAYRALIFVFGGLLLMALLTRGSIWLMSATKQSTPATVFGVMMIGLFILACIACVILTMILMMVRFAKSVHGDEGYLTNTLPVGIHTIILSRLLVSFVAALCSILAVYLSYRIVTFKLRAYGRIESMLSYAFNSQGIEGTRLLIETICIAVIGILTSILQLFAAVSIGHSFASKKAGMSVLFYFVLYGAMQTVSVMLLFGIFGLSTLSSDVGVQESSDWMMIISGAESLIFGCVFYFLTWRMMKKHLNLA